MNAYRQSGKKKVEPKITSDRKGNVWAVWREFSPPRSSHS